MPNTYGCSFVFYGDDDVDALENRIIAALETEGLDFDPMTVTVERTNTAEPEGGEMLDVIPTEFPLDKDGKPLAWPDPNQPDEYIDAWNGIYDSREAALAVSRDWTALESERQLPYGAAPLPGEGEGNGA